MHFSPTTTVRFSTWTLLCRCPPPFTPRWGHQNRKASVGQKISSRQNQYCKTLFSISTAPAHHNDDDAATFPLLRLQQILVRRHILVLHIMLCRILNTIGSSESTGKVILRPPPQTKKSHQRCQMVDSYIR